MMRVKWHLVVLGLLLGLSCLLLGCSDDNDPVGPGGGNGDTTAPLVVGIEPANLQSGVAVDATITITFNEDMDQTSHEDQVTLSTGTITDLAWTTARVLTVDHAGWDEGAAVTVTVGTGLSDLAGNQLATPYSVTFYTDSTDLVFLASNPADGDLDVNRSTRINLLFSAPMNEASVAANLSLQDAAQNDLSHTVDLLDDGWLQVVPDEALPASTTIHLTIAAGAQDEGGRALADPVSIIFITSDEVDTTPPTITSIVPASGSTIPTSTSTIVMTFSEPMQPESVTPTEMGAEFWTLVAAAGTEPVWSQNTTVLTISLPTPLPAGMPLWATFAGYSDANGVQQPAATQWSVTVAGTADYYPVVDGQQMAYGVEWEEGVVGQDDPLDSGTGHEFIRFDFQAGDLFHRAFYLDATYQQSDSGEIMRRTSTALQMHGFYEDEGSGIVTMTFDQPLTFLQFPPAVGQNWSDVTTVDEAPGIEISTSATWVEQLDRMALSYGKDQIMISWTDVWVATLSYTMSEDGTQFLSGTDTMYLAPGIGLVKVVHEETDHQEAEWKRSESTLLMPDMR